MIFLLLIPIALGVAVVAAYLHERRCPECGEQFPSGDEMYHHLDRAH